MGKFSGAFIDLGIEGFNFDAVLEADTFFSIETLIDTISIFETQGVDITDGEFVQEWIRKSFLNHHKYFTGKFFYPQKGFRRCYFR